VTAGKFDWSTVGGRPANQPQAQQESQNDAFSWESVGGRPANKKTEKPIAPKQPEQQSESDYLEQVKKTHPLIYKLAEKLQGNPNIQKAADIAGHFNNAVEGTGLPSAAKGFFETGENIGRGVANLIPGVNIPQQSHKQLNVNPYVGEAAETIGSLGMGLPVYRGYQAATKGLESLPYAKKIPELLRKLIAGGATGAAISPDNRSLGAGLGTGAELVPAALQGGKNLLGKYNVKGKEAAYLKSVIEHQMQEAEHEKLKNLVSHQFGSSNPESLMLGAGDKAKQLEEAQNFQKNRLGQEKMLPGQQLIPEAEHAVKNVNDVIRQTLGEGEPNIQKLSDRIVEAIEGTPTTEPHPKTGLPRQVRVGGLREEIGSQYDKLGDSLPDIKVKGTPDMAAVEKEMQQYFGKNSNLTDEQKENFKKAFAASHPSAKTRTINGPAFFKSYRALRQMESAQRHKAFGLPIQAHDEWIAKANQTKHTYEDMEKLIGEHFPKDTLERLHKINHEYSTKVAPLHDNPVYQTMLKHGKYDSDAIKALSGTTKGNDILRGIITSDPELSKMLVGHSFASNPEKLLKPNKLVEPYIKANPELQRLLGFQKEAQQQMETAQQTAALHKNIEKIPQLTQDIRQQKSLAKKLLLESEVKDITKSQAQLKKHEYEKAQKKLRTLTNRLISLAMATGTIGYLGKKISE